MPARRTWRAGRGDARFLQASPVGGTAAGAGWQVTRPAGELLSRHGLAAAVPAARLPEKYLSSTAGAPQRIPVLLIGILADDRGRVLALDQAPKSGSSTDPGDDAHRFSVAEPVVPYELMGSVITTGSTSAARWTWLGRWLTVVAGDRNSGQPAEEGSARA